MQLIFHMGAHYTEEDRLLRCLLRNKEDFAKRGVAVPGPGRYRKLIRDTLNAMKLHEPAAQGREVLLDAILDEERADRMILSNAHIFGPAKSAVQAGRLYPKATDKLTRLVRLFSEDEVTMFMALRNPATFLHTLAERVDDPQLDSIVTPSTALSIRWSELIDRIRQDVPNLKLTLWCNEDAPLIWAQIIREMGGIEEGEKITGGFDLLSEIMSTEGMQRFRTYLASHPQMGEQQKRRVMEAFLDKFAVPDAVEQELDLPDWDTAFVDQMTAQYEDDVLAIQAMPGVNFLLA